ncbi:MAG: beta-lactamase family protein [Clostridia bacterium]|nr:beta-lactamase family protein [Clostridia bacterium]
MNFDALSAYLDTLARADIKQFVCCVAQNHEVLYSKAVGHFDHACTVPADLNGIYLLYSVTKVLTCTAALRLMEEGRIGLDDPVSKYLPAYKNLTVRTEAGIVPSETPMTVRHCFLMESGYGARLNPDIVAAVEACRARNPEAGTVEIVSAFADTPLEFVPGTHYKYGLSHDILAAVVEVASGMTFGEYLKKNIFDPLEMTDFTFRLSPEQEPRLCHMFRYDSLLNRSTPIPMPNVQPYGTNFESGGSGLYGSPMQYLRFADALACGGVADNGYRVLRAESIAMAQKNLLSDVPLGEFRKSPRKYGYGWGLCGRVHMDSAISLSRSPEGEFGWDSAAASYVLMDTKNKLSIYCAMQTRECTYAYEKIHPHVRDLVYDLLKL